MTAPSTLRDRLRGIVAPGAAQRAPLAGPAESDRAGEPGSAKDGPAPAPGAVLAPEGSGQRLAPVVVIDRRRSPDEWHGAHRIGDFARRLTRSAVHAPLLTGGVSVPSPWLFFDLETTGLNGGAGTHAFLVGCGWFEADGAFVTRQHLLTTPAGERRMLDAVAPDFERAGALVSFNGKSFDAPLLEMRCAFHRLAWSGRGRPHVDVLHPARRFWGTGRLARAGGAVPAAGGRPAARSTRAGDWLGGDAGDEAESACSLGALESRVLGARREGDVPGFEIPARYFAFVRSGDLGPIEAVLEHNRLDLLSLAGLTARLLHLADEGPSAASSPRETLALGRMYQRAGQEDRAREACERAASAGGDDVRLEALSGLARIERRARRFDEAAAWWHAVIDTAGCPAVLAREAAEALAIHHEHRVRDLDAAKTFVLRGLERGDRPAAERAARHRLARLERKMEGRASLAFRP